jgi:hypothetical protein
MAKKSGKSKGRGPSPSKKKAGAGRRAVAASRGGKRRTAGAKTPKGKAGRKQPTNPSRAGKRKTAAKKTPRAVSRPARETTRKRSKSSPAVAIGRGPSPRLGRDRKILREVDQGVPTPPSSLDLDRGASAARTGRQKLQDSREDHTETSPVMTGGDVDAHWQDAYSVGDEAPGGDNPTPDQDRVDDIGKALGVVYEDNEELKASDKIADRDKHRWELDPASSEDYKDRD